MILGWVFFPCTFDNIFTLNIFYPWKFLTKQNYNPKKLKSLDTKFCDTPREF